MDPNAVTAVREEMERAQARPPILKERDRPIGRGDPVLDRYARVTLEKSLIIGQPQTELLAPGHPLLDAAVDVVLERFQPLLRQGVALVDESDDGTAPRLLVYLEHAIRDGRVARSGEPRVVSQRLQFIHLTEDDAPGDGGPAPYLDYRPATSAEKPLADEVARAGSTASPRRSSGRRRCGCSSSRCP